MTAPTKSRGSLFGLLAMFGVLADGKLPKLSTNVSSGHRKAPSYIQDWLKERARAKRMRRAMKPDASNYALRNAGIG